ncbi:hypothetical protein V6N13_053579 [Hibiscus sabdariffa]
MEKPKRKEKKSPRHRPNEGLPRQKISQADILQLVTAVKTRPIFPPENSWQSNPRQKRVCQILGNRQISPWNSADN